jgi:hypothetical protein
MKTWQALKPRRTSMTQVSENVIHLGLFSGGMLLRNSPELRQADSEANARRLDASPEVVGSDIAPEPDRVGGEASLEGVAPESEGL